MNQNHLQYHHLDKISIDEANLFQESPLLQNKPFLLEKVNGCTLPLAQPKHSWKREQKIKYLAFVYYSMQTIKVTQRKALWRICKLMSKFIATRNPNQCRIFHKQMMAKFNSIDQMFNSIELQVPSFRSILEDFEQQLTKQLYKVQKTKNQNQITFKEIYSQKLQPTNCFQQKEPVQFNYHSPSFKKFHGETDIKMENCKTDETYKEEKPSNRYRTSIDPSAIQNSLFQHTFNENYHLSDWRNLYPLQYSWMNINALNYCPFPNMTRTYSSQSHQYFSGQTFFTKKPQFKNNSNPIQ